VKSGAELKTQAGFPIWGKSGLFYFWNKDAKMRDLSKWVRCNGRIYCWDKLAGNVMEIKITYVPMDQVPEYVLVAMLNYETREINNWNEQGF
jgi:hypothetical protein